MLLHHITEENILDIEQALAVMTPCGWVIPEWVQLLRATPQHPRPVDGEHELGYGMYPYVLFGVHHETFLAAVARNTSLRWLHEHLEGEPQ